MYNKKTNRYFKNQERNDKRFQERNEKRAKQQLQEQLRTEYRNEYQTDYRNEYQEYQEYTQPNKFIYYITNFMDVGVIHDYFKKETFDKQTDFSYFHYDDYWNLKSKNYQFNSSFFNFHDTRLFGSIE